MDSGLGLVQVFFGKKVVLVHRANQKVRHAIAEGAALEASSFSFNDFSNIGENTIAGNSNDSVNLVGNLKHVHGNAKFPLSFARTVYALDDLALLYFHAAVAEMIQEGSLIKAFALNDICRCANEAALAYAMTEHFGVGEIPAKSFFGGVVHVLDVNENGNALAL